MVIVPSAYSLTEDNFKSGLLYGFEEAVVGSCPPEMALGTERDERRRAGWSNSARALESRR